MLVIMRAESETFDIYHAGEKVTIHLLENRGNRSRIGIEGPKSFVVIRSELEKHDEDLPISSDR